MDEKEKVQKKADALYSEAVHETPPNRTKLDHLVDLLCDHPQLLYESFFDKGHEAASIVVDVWHGTGDMNADDNLSILTPPAAWGWMVMEETVCHAPPLELMETKYPQLAQKFLDLAAHTLKHVESTPGLIVRRSVQALTRFWPEIINACISLKTTNPVWKQMYERMLELAQTLMQMSERSDDPALQMHLVKFLETEATIFTPIPQLGASPRSTLNLDMLPDAHPYIDKAALAKRGERARQQLVRLLPSSDHMRLCNTSFITAIINSIVYLMNLRPQFCQDLLERLTNWYAVINSSEQTMTHLQLVIISKALRIALLHLYTRRYMGAYSEVLESTLDTLGGPEWIRWQEQQARERERRQRQRAREREQAPRQPDTDGGHHSARWVPAPEDGQEDLAYQPAPGADADFGVSLPDSAGTKRAAGTIDVDDDDDEEKQMRLLEESAKRVKLEEEKEKEPSVLSPEEEQRLERHQRAQAVDKEMEDEMQKVLLSEKQFDLPLMDSMPLETRQEHVIEAIRRVAAGSEQLRKFIEHKRILHDVPGSLNLTRHKKVLENGLSSNGKVLEDSMVMLVRLVSNCYIVFYEANSVDGANPDMGPSTRWGELHTCIDQILQSIIDSPRTHYELAMILLYELWMSVVITDPELKRTPDKPENKYTVLALYLQWCESIFDAIVKSSIELTIASASVPASAQTTGTDPANGAAVVPQQQQQPDELILNFIKDAPYLLPAHLSKIEECLKSPKTALLGFTTLERAIELRPSIFNAGLNILLTYSAHPERTTRVGCIRAVKKHYPNGSSAQRIVTVANTSFIMGMDSANARAAELEKKVKVIFERVDEPAPENEEKSTEAIEKRKAEALALRKQEEQGIEAGLVVHMELLLALSTKNIELLSAVFEAYKKAAPTVQVTVRRIITPLIKSMVNTPTKIIPVLIKFPAGSETLALRIIYLLCVDGARVPAKELVQAVLNMCDARKLDGNFIVFILSGMDREEALRRLPMVVSLLNNTEGPRVMLRESFSRLTTSYLNRPSVLSPTQLLMGLHDPSVAATGSKAMEAISVYESMTKPDGTHMFSTAVFDTALKLLSEQEHLSSLMLHTADVYYRQRNGPVGTVIKLLQKLIERKVWQLDESLMKAFVHSFRVMQPGTLALVKSIPQDALKQMVEMDKDLASSIREYVGKMNEQARKPYKWLFK
ncbi:hypothetical protein IWW36_000697 [Coemansia brasiliensis]|uniref:Symplekin n=1 Tax=Coemansia brasiliensis TaxID=2650707 RepID=A0A9W8IAC3_9FUNG|nr:hypothetical protein IWW36_000697 [Coemansia brasiliensis]